MLPGFVNTKRDLTAICIYSLLQYIHVMLQISRFIVVIKILMCKWELKKDFFDSLIL